MFLFRALAKPSLLNGVDETGEMSSCFLNEVGTPNGLYSFFEVEDIENKASDKIMNIVLYMISSCAEKWSSSIGAVFLKEDDLRMIGSLSEEESKPLDVIHRNLGKLNLSQAYKLIDLIFKNKDSLHRYSKDELTYAFKRLEKGQWECLYADKPADTIAANAKKILNTFFRKDLSGPNALLDFVKDKNCRYSFDKQNRAWRVEPISMLSA